MSNKTKRYDHFYDNIDNFNKNIKIEPKIYICIHHSNNKEICQIYSCNGTNYYCQCHCNDFDYCKIKNCENYYKYIFLYKTRKNNDYYN